jgi:sugar phosphate isomerase/epimerase
MYPRQQTTDNSNQEMRKYLLLSLAAIFCFVSLSAQVPDALGVQLYSFRNEMKKDLKGTLKMVKDMGLQTVETSTFTGMNAQETRKMLDAAGLKAVSMGTNFDDLAKPAKWDTIAMNAKTLGAEFVMCPWIPHNGTEFTFQDVKKAADVFNAAGKALKKKGLKLIYHPHGYEFRPYLENTLLFDYLVKNTNKKYVNFEMDIYWIKNPGQDPVTWLRKYPKRWKALHVKDQKKGVPGNQNGQSDVEWNVVAGTGSLDLPGIFREAKKIGVKYYFIEDESSHSVEQVPQTILYLKPLLNQK